MTLEERIEKIKDLRPIDDVFLKYWHKTKRFVKRCCGQSWKMIY